MSGPRASAPPSRRPQARLDHLREMGVVVVNGDLVVLQTQMGERMEWRKQGSSCWYERIDAGAPIAREGAVVYEDIRGERELVLAVQEGRDV